MSYLEMKRVGRQGPTLGLFLLEVALVRNASRANGMRGMAQRISTTPSRSSWKTQHSTQTQRHCGPTIYAAAVSYIVSCVYSLYIYYILYRKFLCPALYGQSSPNFNGQDKTPGHDGVTANCKLFSILLLLFFFFQHHKSIGNASFC